MKNLLCNFGVTQASPGKEFHTFQKKMNVIIRSGTHASTECVIIRSGTRSSTEWIIIRFGTHASTEWVIIRFGLVIVRFETNTSTERVITYSETLSP